MDYESKIKEIEKMREDLVTEVNKQIAFFNGQLAILMELLEEEKKSEQPAKQL